MILTKTYRDYQFQDMGILFKQTNVQFYSYIKNLGIEMDLSKKDQQKIYLHHFIKELCSEILYQKTLNFKIIFYVNLWDVCLIQSKILKKVISLFGIKIFQHHYELNDFIYRLETKECEILDKFELFLEKETKPKTFKQIKKYLNKEGFTELADIHFQDLVNKMAILC